MVLTKYIKENVFPNGEAFFNAVIFRWSLKSNLGESEKNYPYIHEVMNMGIENHLSERQKKVMETIRKRMNSCRNKTGWRSWGLSVIRIGE
jgi:hypothetical protein